MTKTLLAISSALVSFALPTFALAQTDEDAGIDDIVVTAQYRDENLQDVPVAITAFTGAQLENAGVSDTNALETVTPALVMQNTSSALQPTIRGVGTRGSAVGDESNVAMYLDGVYQPSMQANSFELLNIDRVEVLKGPQGTLFGRNATGGTINIVTRDPDFESHTSVQAAVGSFGMTEAAIYTTHGLTETLAADFSFMIHDDDGYLTDLDTGDDYAGRSSFSGRARLLFQPTTDFRAILAVSRTDDQNPAPLAFVPINRNTNARVSNPGVLIPDEPWEVSYNDEIRHNTNQEDASLRAYWDLGFAELQSVSAYQRTDVEQRTDSDGTAQNVTFQAPNTSNETFSQEIRLVSSGDDRLDWVIGGMYFQGNAAFVNYLSGATTVVNSNGNTTAYGLFGEANFEVTERFIAIAGVRYSWEEKDFTSIRNAITQPTVSETWDSLTPRVTLLYELSDDTNVYATYATGFKSGVFNIAAANMTPVDPETLTSYEIGVKSDPARWLRVNASLFHYDYEDLQIQGRDPDGVTRLQNVGVVAIDGGELEVQARPTNDFSIRFGASYLDAVYEDFTNAQIFNPVPAGGNAAVITDVSGNTAMRSPEWTFKLGLDYEREVSRFGSLGAALNVDYNDGFFTDASNRVVQPAFTMVSASVRWVTADGSARVTLFGDNLLNEEVIQYFASSANGDFGALRAPRAYGVRVGMDF